MSSKFTESVVEEAAIQYFQDIGYSYLPGPEIASDGLFADSTVVVNGCCGLFHWCLVAIGVCRVVTCSSVFNG